MEGRRVNGCNLGTLGRGGGVRISLSAEDSPERLVRIPIPY